MQHLTALCVKVPPVREDRMSPIKVGTMFSEASLWEFPCLSGLRAHVTIIALTVSIVLNLGSGQVMGFSSERASFSVKFKDKISPYQVMGVFVLPGEVLDLGIVDPRARTDYALNVVGGDTQQTGDYRWHWRAPVEKGVYPVQVVHLGSDEGVTLNIFVMIPYEQLRGDYLNGYRIGRYPSVHFRGLPSYAPPRGFIEVTPRNRDTLVSPHFTLGQFLCKQESNYPKYLVLKEELILKLELILEKTNQAGHPCDTFHVMSGYRTPFYNEAIGNVKYSRHIYGDAVDIFIDQNPQDGNMDDLNKDRKIDYRDATVLYGIIDELSRTSVFRRLLGGLAWYKRTDSHGPFVHVDVRGSRARWGY